MHCAWTLLHPHEREQNYMAILPLFHQGAVMVAKASQDLTSPRGMRLLPHGYGFQCDLTALRRTAIWRSLALCREPCIKDVTTLRERGHGANAYKHDEIPSGHHGVSVPVTSIGQSRSFLTFHFLQHAFLPFFCVVRYTGPSDAFSGASR